MRRKVIYLVFLILTLPVVIYLTDQIQRLLSKAAPVPANIVIDTKQPLGLLSQPWLAFAQGGEEPPPMLSNAVDKMKDLSPRYIRLDHLYDYYKVVQKNGDNVRYDFSQLDKTVDDILATNALPFFSLSYMPSQFTNSGSVIDNPKDWNDWKSLVRTTIERYSGKTGKNLTGVYYEVWNEPELPQFGNWKLSGDKDYRLLYYHTSKAAEETKETNQFFLGGPAIGSYYPDWIREFLAYTEQNKLRLDFFSWHRYHKNPEIFSSDVKNIKNLLKQTGEHQNLPLIITEWGLESENNAINNSNAAAAFTVAALSGIRKNVALAFVFEIKDGPPPNGGKWGLLTHEKDAVPLSPKPRYKVFSFLKKLEGEELLLYGQGTFVKGFASKKDDIFRVILANYDLSGKNTENVPVSFSGLEPASYNLKYSYPLEETTATQEIISTDGTVNKSFPLPANSVLYLELDLNARLASFVPGKIEKTGDQSLALSGDNKLLLHSPEFRLRPSGKIEFDFKPFWGKNDNRSFIIFDTPFTIEKGIIKRLFLAKQNKNGKQTLVFGISENSKEMTTVALPVNLEKNVWYNLATIWNPSNLSLSVNGVSSLTNGSFDIRNGELITFYPVEAALDNLKITLGENQVIERTFDGEVNK